MPKTIYSVVDNGAWSSAGLGEGAKDMTWRQLRNLQETLLDAVVDLERKIQTMIPEKERLNPQVEIDRTILVKTTEAEVEHADFTTAAAVATLIAMDDCDIQIEPKPVTHPWLLERLEYEAEEAAERAKTEATE